MNPWPKIVGFIYNEFGWELQEARERVDLEADRQSALASNIGEAVRNYADEQESLRKQQERNSSRKTIDFAADFSVQASEMIANANSPQRQRKRSRERTTPTFARKPNTVEPLPTTDTITFVWKPWPMNDATEQFIQSLQPAKIARIISRLTLRKPSETAQEFPEREQMSRFLADGALLVNRPMWLNEARNVLEYGNLPDVTPESVFAQRVYRGSNNCSVVRNDNDVRETFLGPTNWLLLTRESSPVYQKIMEVFQRAGSDITSYSSVGQVYDVPYALAWIFGRHHSAFQVSEAQYFDDTNGDVRHIQVRMQRAQWKILPFWAFILWKSDPRLLDQSPLGREDDGSCATSSLTDTPNRSDEEVCLDV